jgi:hypothetical protein
LTQWSQRRIAVKQITQWARDFEEGIAETVSDRLINFSMLLAIPRREGAEVSNKMFEMYQYRQGINPQYERRKEYEDVE